MLRSSFVGGVIFGSFRVHAINPCHQLLIKVSRDITPSFRNLFILYKIHSILTVRRTGLKH